MLPEAQDELGSEEQEIFLLQPARRRTSCSSGDSNSSTLTDTAAYTYHEDSWADHIDPPAAIWPDNESRKNARNFTCLGTTASNILASGHSAGTEPAPSSLANTAKSNTSRTSKRRAARAAALPAADVGGQQQQQQQRKGQKQAQQAVTPQQQLKQQHGLLKNHQSAEVCELCKQPLSLCRASRCRGYCTHCKKSGHSTTVCRKLAAAKAAGTKNVNSSGSSSAPEVLQPTQDLRPEILLHKATAIHAVQQLVGNAAIKQQLKAVIQGSARQQIVPDLHEHLQCISATVLTDLDLYSSDDLEQLVTLAELVAAAKQLMTKQQSGRGAAAAAAAAAVNQPVAAVNGGTPAAAVSNGVARAAAEGHARTPTAAKPAVLAAAKQQRPRPLQSTSAAATAHPPRKKGQVRVQPRPPPPPPPAATAAAAVPPATFPAQPPPPPPQQQLLRPPPPPPVRQTAAAAAAAAPSSATAASYQQASSAVDTYVIPSAAAYQPVQLQQQQQQQQQPQTGFQQPHPMYAGAAASAAGAAVNHQPAAVSATTAAAAVDVSGALTSWMLWLKPGALRAVQELIVQDYVVRDHLLKIVTNAFDWQLVTVLYDELVFLSRLVAAGQLRLQDVNGLRQLQQLLSEAKQQFEPASNKAAAAAAAAVVPSALNGCHQM